MNINHNKKKLIYTTIIALVIAVLSGIMSFFGFPKRLEYVFPFLFPAFLREWDLYLQAF